MKQSISTQSTAIFSQWTPTVIGIAYFIAFLLFVISRL